MYNAGTSFLEHLLHLLWYEYSTSFLYAFMLSIFFVQSVQGHERTSSYRSFYLQRCTCQVHEHLHLRYITRRHGATWLCQVHEQAGGGQMAGYLPAAHGLLTGIVGRTWCLLWFWYRRASFCTGGHGCRRNGHTYMGRRTS